MNEKAIPIQELKHFTARLTVAKKMLQLANVELHTIQNEMLDSSFRPAEGQTFVVRVRAYQDPIRIEKNVKITEDDNRRTPNWVGAHPSEVPQEVAKMVDGEARTFYAGLVEYDARLQAFVALDEERDYRVVLESGHILDEETVS